MLVQQQNYLNKYTYLNIPDMKLLRKSGGNLILKQVFLSNSNLINIEWHLGG